MEASLGAAPHVVKRNILEFLTYEEASGLRLVNKHFDYVCQCYLNAGLGIGEQYLLKLIKKVKALLPRRESERRRHPLHRYTDVLSALETRLSLLRMTYGRYIEAGVCCFIPGKVLDELFRVLRLIDKFQVAKLGEVLQELRDISSMAMEHFDDHIAPSLKSRLAIYPSPSNIAPLRIRDKFSLVPEACSSAFKTPTPSLRDACGEKTHRDLNQKFQKMKKKVDEQEKAMRQLEARIEEQDGTLEELRARNIEQDATLSELQAQVTELLARGMKPTGLDIAPTLNDLSKKRGLDDVPSNPQKKRKE